jgi:hypothetical protein
MSSTKLLLCGAVLGVAASPVVLAFASHAAPAPDRPGDFTPAQSPIDALEQFREFIRKHDYKTAARYLADGEYRVQFSKSAEAAAQLATEIDSLLQAVEIVGLRTPDGKSVLQHLRPFPKDFEFGVPGPINDDQYKLLSKAFPEDFPPDRIKPPGDKVVVAKLDLKLDAAGGGGGKRTPGRVGEKICLALVPAGRKWDGLVAIKNVGTDKEKNWKIFLPLTADLPKKADYLRVNYGNYAQALKNVKYAVKHDAATKTSFEADLSKELAAAE